MTSEKIDLYKLHKEEYITPKKPKLIETKPAGYLAITGQGEPGEEVFVSKLESLYSVAYTIKMARKSEGRDYTICKLEALWWGSKGNADFSQEPMSEWNWKFIIRTPDFVTDNHLKDAVTILLKKGKEEQVKEVKLNIVDEGLCVQMLHLGSYQNEEKTINMMKEFVEEKDLLFHGLHHEIYLSDPRRVPEERLKTIIRMPVC